MQKQTSTNAHYGLDIRGSAGTITKQKLSPDKEAALRAKLSQALDTEHALLPRLIRMINF